MNGEYNYKRCHSGAKPVLSIGKATIYAAREADIGEVYYDMKLVLCLLGESGVPEPAVKMSNTALQMLPRTARMRRKKRPALMTFEWKDMSVPNLSGWFWKEFVKDIKNVDGDVLIYCMGGHGRTGTALAILAGLSGVTKGIDPVEWIRERYCDRVVETMSQVNYINKMGVETHAKPSNIMRPVVTTGYTMVPTSLAIDGSAGAGEAVTTRETEERDAELLAQYSGKASLSIDEDGDFLDPEARAKSDRMIDEDVRARFSEDGASDEHDWLSRL